LPLFPVVAQIVTEGLLPPGAIDRVGDGREGGDRLIATGVFQGADQRTVAAHGVTTDTALVRDREVRLHYRRQLADHMVVHAVMLRPGLRRRIDIETRAQSEIPGAVRIVRHTLAARAGIWRHD